MLFAKSKFPKLSALIEKCSEATAEEITAVNEELKAAGLNGVVLVSAAAATEMEANVTALATAQASLNTATEEVTRLTSELSTANESLTTVNDSIATLTTERDAFKAQAEAFGSQPGAMGTQPVKVGGDRVDVSAATDAQKEIDELPHNKAIANNPLFN